MSLTSIMEGGFSAEVMKEIPFPIDVFIDDNCVASPISENRSLVGTAFDYMLRLELLRANPRAREEDLVGQYAIKHFDEKMSVSYKEDAHSFILNFLGIFENFFMEKMGYKDIKYPTSWDQVSSFTCILDVVFISIKHPSTIKSASAPPTSNEVSLKLGFSHTDL